MHVIERLAVAVRHNRWLARADWLWNAARPVYERAISVIGKNGLERTINGTDRIRLLPRYRTVVEVYEPEVWPRLMADVRPGGTIVDVGAFIGICTVAFANRVGPCGSVIALEPDPDSVAALREHIALNGVADRVEVLAIAAGAVDGEVWFESGREMQSSVAAMGTDGATLVRCSRLDTVLAGRSVDLIKIDVEGYEEAVLQGARALMTASGRPRAVYIEVHPYAWPSLNATETGLLALLRDAGYRATAPDGAHVARLDRYGSIVARRPDA